MNTVNSFALAAAMMTSATTFASATSDDESISMGRSMLTGAVYNSLVSRGDDPASIDNLTLGEIAQLNSLLHSGEMKTSQVDGQDNLLLDRADSFAYEVCRTEAEWRAMLDPQAFAILRRGATEMPKSHPLWESTSAGSYSCRGCELPLYDAIWKSVLDMGWLFFSHGYPNAHLFGIDRPEPKEREAATSEVLDHLALVETHCRRCAVATLVTSSPSKAVCCIVSTAPR